MIGQRHFRSDEKFTAVILGGGKGARLSPLTIILQKVLIEVPPVGEPLLAYTIRNLSTTQIDEIVCLVNYRADQVRRCINNRFPQVGFSEDDARTAGTTAALLKAAREGKINRDHVLILNGDIYLKFNLFNLEELLIQHLKSSVDATIITSDYRLPVGICFADEENRVKQLLEKPRLSNLGSTYLNGSLVGAFILEKNLISRLEPLAETDDLVTALDKLLHESSGIKMNAFALPSQSWLDIGTWTSYGELWDNYPNAVDLVRKK